jgi:hypothetical protein
MKIVWRCPLRAGWFVDQGKSASISMNEFMPAKTNTRYRWVIVAAGGLLGCVAIGSLFSLPEEAPKGERRRGHVLPFTF